MGSTMLVNDDPDASLVAVVGFAAFTLAFAALAVALFRPLFRSGDGTRTPAP